MGGRSGRNPVRALGTPAGRLTVERKERYRWPGANVRPGANAVAGRRGRSAAQWPASRALGSTAGPRPRGLVGLAPRKLRRRAHVLYAASTSLPFFDRSGSVHAARSKQQGRRLPDRSFEMPTSTRRLRVSGFLVALIQRTHSQRAIGVISSHNEEISDALARAVRKSFGMSGSGQSLVGSISTATASPSPTATASRNFLSTLSQ